MLFELRRGTWWVNDFPGQHRYDEWESLDSGEQPSSYLDATGFQFDPRIPAPPVKKARWAKDAQ